MATSWPAKTSTKSGRNWKDWGPSESNRSSTTPWRKTCPKRRRRNEKSRKLTIRFYSFPRHLWIIRWCLLHIGRQTCQINGNPHPLQVFRSGSGWTGSRGLPEAVPRGQDVRRQAVQGAVRQDVLLPEWGHLREEHGDLHQVPRGHSRLVPGVAVLSIFIFGLFYLFIVRG